MDDGTVTESRRRQECLQHKGFQKLAMAGSSGREKSSRPTRMNELDPTPATPRWVVVKPPFPVNELIREQPFCGVKFNVKMAFSEANCIAQQRSKLVNNCVLKELRERETVWTVSPIWGTQG